MTVAEERGQALLNRVERWKNLCDLPSASQSRDCVSVSDTHQPQSTVPAPAQPPAPPPVDLQLTDAARRLALDLIPHPFLGCVERQEHLGISARAFEQSKRELEERTFIKAVQFGLTLFLIPTSDFYTALALEPPKIKRQLSLEHSFAIRLAHHLVSQEPLVRRVDIEVPVGESGATVDLVTHLKDGNREAWEVTLSVGNIAANAAKLQDKGFSRVLFLCRNTQVRQAAWARLRESGLAPDLVARCRCVLFSALLKRQKRILR